MFEYYFYESNRDIVTENVVKCYSMISKYGFQPSMGKIMTSKVRNCIKFL